MYSMKQYKVEYDREGCIGVGSCVAAAPKVWDLDDENKAVFKIDFEGDEKLQSAIITQDQLEAVKESAIVCPVQVIKIYDLETGEQVY